MSRQRDNQQFIARLSRELPAVNYYDIMSAARKLSRYASGLHTISERICSEEMSDREAARLDKRDESLTRLAREVCESVGLKLIEGTGDPRGCPLLVGVPSGATDDWVQRGIVVPYGRD